jgi:hypothetical protein
MRTRAPVTSAPVDFFCWCTGVLVTGAQ